MTTRGIRRKKSTLTELKVAVVGAPCVGKSALIVRFITKRYIGEYDHQTANMPIISPYDLESRYKHEALVDGDPVIYEILDTCPKEAHELPNAGELLHWADGLLLVYSITDRESFNYIRRAKSELLTDTPMSLVANKVDMVHLRQVSYEEGEILAKDFECKFSEVSAADHVDQVVDIFHDLCKDVMSSKRKSKQSLLERMLASTRPYSRGKSDSNLSKD